MDATYRMFAEFAQTWGLLYFVAIFFVGAGYALRPSKQKLFDEAARLPLRED